jgi:hypothetical protein
MAIVTWHDDNWVVMPSAMARRYDEAELFVEYIASEPLTPPTGILRHLLSFFRR